MTETLRPAAKAQLIKILKSEGYPTYAALLSYFDIYTTDDPDFVAAMVPNKAKIIINELLSRDQVSTVVRHEILHEWFNHYLRSKEVEKSDPTLGSNSQLANVAADFDISNRGYTSKDKTIVRSLRLDGVDKDLSGLITEDQRPGWEHKSFEEMYSELLKEQAQNKQDLQNLIDKLIDAMNEGDEENDNSNSSSSQSQNSPQASKSSSKSSSSDSPDDSQDSTSSSGAQSTEQSDSSDKTASSAEKALDQAEQALDQATNKLTDQESDDSLPTQADQAAVLDLAERVKKIKEILRDPKQREAALQDTKKIIDRQAAREIERKEYEKLRDPLKQFKLNLYRFIQSKIQTSRERSDDIFNPSYIDNGFLVPGILDKEDKSIPVINVYWDVSGSFNSVEKTEGARKAIASLNEFVRNGDIEIKPYYFATQVSNTKAGAGGGTEGTPIQDHIDQTKPDNVIIITDGDIHDCTRITQVPGAVWMLFYDSQSQNLIDHIIGKQETKHFFIPRGSY